MAITVEGLYKATENDVGKLCYFYDTGCEKVPHLDILESYNPDEEYAYRALHRDVEYQHARLLTPKEVEKLTGYEVHLPPIEDYDGYITYLTNKTRVR